MHWLQLEASSLRGEAAASGERAQAAAVRSVLVKHVAERMCKSNHRNRHVDGFVFDCCQWWWRTAQHVIKTNDARRLRRRVAELEEQQKQATQESERLATEVAALQQALAGAQAAIAAAVQAAPEGTASPAQVIACVACCRTACIANCRLVTASGLSRQPQWLPAHASTARLAMHSTSMWQEAAADSLVRQIARLQAAHAEALEQLRQQSAANAEELAARARDKVQLQAAVGELQSTLTQVLRVAVRHMLPYSESWRRAT